MLVGSWAMLPQNHAETLHGSNSDGRDSTDSTETLSATPASCRTNAGCKNSSRSTTRPAMASFLRKKCWICLNIWAFQGPKPKRFSKKLTPIGMERFKYMSPSVLEIKIKVIRVLFGPNGENSMSNLHCLYRCPLSSDGLVAIFYCWGDTPAVELCFLLLLNHRQVHFLADSQQTVLQPPCQPWRRWDGKYRICFRKFHAADFEIYLQVHGLGKCRSSWAKSDSGGSWTRQAHLQTHVASHQISI